MFGIRGGAPQPLPGAVVPRKMFGNVRKCSEMGGGCSLSHPPPGRWVPLKCSEMFGNVRNYYPEGRLGRDTHSSEHFPDILRGTATPRMGGGGSTPHFRKLVTPAAQPLYYSVGCRACSEGAISYNSRPDLEGLKFIIHLCIFLRTAKKHKKCPRVGLRVGLRG